MSALAEHRQRALARDPLEEGSSEAVQEPGRQARLRAGASVEGDGLGVLAHAGQVEAKVALSLEAGSVEDLRAAAAAWSARGFEVPVICLPVATGDIPHREAAAEDPSHNVGPSGSVRR